MLTTGEYEQVSMHLRLDAHGHSPHDSSSRQFDSMERVERNDELHHKQDNATHRFI